MAEVKVLSNKNEYEKIPNVCYWHSDDFPCVSKKQTQDCPSICPRYNKGTIEVYCSNPMCFYTARIYQNNNTFEMCPKCESEVKAR